MPLAALPVPVDDLLHGADSPDFFIPGPVDCAHAASPADSEDLVFPSDDGARDEVALSHLFIHEVRSPPAGLQHKSTNKKTAGMRQFSISSLFGSSVSPDALFPCLPLQLRGGHTARVLTGSVAEAGRGVQRFWERG